MGVFYLERETDEILSHAAIQIFIKDGIKGELEKNRSGEF